MATIAEFTLPASEFPLGRVFQEMPAVRMDLDRVVPTTDTMMPYFWVEAPEGDLDRVLALLETVPELRSAALIEDLGTNGLFRAEWEPDMLGLMEALDQTAVTVLSASGSSHGWLFELRAVDSSELSDFQRHCESLEIEIALERISQISKLSVDTSHALTTEQQEALELAYENGYYDDSRGTNLEQLAEQLDISRQALSARLRRGYRRLIEQEMLYHDRRNT